MAVVSEGALYQARIAPSYVSSSGYYGYVPPCPIADYENVVQQQLGRVAEANDQTASCNHNWTLSTNSFSMTTTNDRQNQQCERNNQHFIRVNGSAMETDEDDNCRNEYVGVSRCQNNRCVIPEAAGRLDGSGCVYRVVEQEADPRRGNRKRNSAGDPAYLLFAGQTTNHAKRTKPDGGNGNVCDASGSSRKRGSSTLHYEQTPLSYNGKIGYCNLPYNNCNSPNSYVDCRTAAGNYDDIGVSDMERPCIVATNGNDKFGDSYLDYEIMLMETHGCSSYHYRPERRLDINVAEAEF